MWMMGYNEGGEFNNIMAADSFGGHKLRPLIPRPSPAAPINNATTTLSRIHGNDLLSFNRHLEQSKRLDQFNTQQVVVSSRWSPTPEQLHILEELYRRGTRTPSTDHIKHITAQLRRYGKIEGKNVFYWFQNHKARERQKRRRQLESPPSDEQQFNAESGANRTGVEFEQTRNWALPTKFSALAERSGSSIQRSAVVKSGGGPDGWLQYEEGELQQHTRSLAERNATWQMMELSFSPPPPINLLINPTSTITSTTTSPATVRSMDPKLIDADQDFSIFIGRPHPEDLGRWITVRNYEEAGSCDESQTLELFPLRSSECTDGKNCLGEESDGSVGAKNVANISTPCQFFEFLPLKN